MACDWCDKNKVLERIEQEFDDDLYLCDGCREEWGRSEYYSSRTEP